MLFRVPSIQSLCLCYTGFIIGYVAFLQADPRHEEILGQLLYAAKIVAEKEGILDGFRVVINNGPSACKFTSLLCFVDFFSFTEEACTNGLKLYCDQTHNLSLVRESSCH